MSQSDTVALFSTCLVDSFAPEVSSAAQGIVAATGARTAMVRHLCCGQPAWNAGHRTQAQTMGRAIVRHLSPYSRIVVPSASCAAMLQHVYPQLFAPGDPDFEAAQGIAARTVEWTNYLQPWIDRVPWTADAPMPAAVHISCHALRGTYSGPATEHCIHAVGCPLIRHRDAQECCGFGGLFAVNEAALSTAMADRKLDALMASGAQTVIVNELGCLLHLEGRADRRGLPLRFRHLVEVLAQRWSPGGTPHAD